jgi:hypothetical protein
VKWRLAVEITLVVVLLGGSSALRLYIARDGYVLTGADSYGYVHLAEELRQHGRYALGPTEPPYFARMPLYPWFIRFVKGEARAEQDGGPGWPRIQRGQMVLDLGTALLVYFLLRRRGGRILALVGLTLVAYWPPLVGASLTGLSECLATLLTTAALTVLIWREEVSVRRLFGASLLIGVGVLARQDALALAPALLLGAVLSKPRLIRTGIAIGGVLLALSPWVIRNLVVFHKTYILGARIDRYGAPFPHWKGFHSWMASWAVDETSVRAQFCFYDPRCQTVLQWAPRAYFDLDDSAAAEALLKQRKNGVDPEIVSDGFAALAVARRKAHPFRVLIGHPVQRATRLWIASEWPIRPPLRAFRVRPYIPYVAGSLGIGWLVGGVLLLVRRGRRRLAMILLSALIVRTVALAWLYYAEPRYIVELLPAAIIVMVLGLAGWGRDPSQDSRSEPV